MIKIKTPYTVTADISKHNGDVFNRNPDINYLSQKRIELDKLGDSLGYSIDGVLAEELSKFCGLNPTNDIKDIALQLEEDVAILHKGIVRGMLFCFPSGFIPRTKVGLTFSQLHEPVADNDKLQRASDKVVQLISQSGVCYRRYVWTLTSSPKLSRHPIYLMDEPSVVSKDQLYFRMETQTTIGHTDNESTFFFVKVDVKPFMDLDNDMREQLISSINSMSEDTLIYKNLKGIKELL